MKTDYNLSTFKAITTFVNDLSEIFAADNHALKLYQRLIEKTTPSHEKAVQKHIEAFKSFCVDNREAILNKNISKLNSNTVKYSDKVFIDFASIFRSADRDTTNVIWSHLLTISAYVDPTAKAKEILKQNVTGNEADFLSDVINKVESHITPENAANPLLAVSSILSSGVFSDLLTTMNSGMKDGTLDLGKLLGSVQKIATNLSGDNGSDSNPNLGNMINMLSGMIPPPQSQSTPSPPGEFDVSKLMNMVSAISESNKTDSVTEIIEDEKDT